MGTDLYILDNPDGAWRSVDCGLMWPHSEDLGPCFWDSWVCSRTVGNGYILSGGEAGRHELLFGFNGTVALPEGTCNQAGGNLCDAQGEAVSFAAGEGLWAGEWGNVAAGWDGSHIWTYVNGVPCSKLAHTNGRYAQGPGLTHQRLWLFGSNHSNWNGRIAGVRGFEGFFGHPEANAEQAFRPTWPFAPYQENGASAGRPCDFLMTFTSSSKHHPGLFRDESPVGYKGAFHPGRLIGPQDGTNRLPYFTASPDFPYQNWSDTPRVPAVNVPTPAAVPAGAGIFDSFSRRNRTRAFPDTLTLGSTEGGSSGSLPWQEGAIAPGDNSTGLFGILHGQAVVLAGSKAVTWVQAPAQPLEMRINRRYWDQGSVRSFGIAFRVANRSNFHVAYLTGTTMAGRRLHLGRIVDGNYSEFSEDVCPATSWATLKVVDPGDGVIQGYCDNQKIAEVTGKTADLTVKGVGMMPTYSGSLPYGLDRGDNFTVLF